jgi:ribosome recycling factor
LHTQPRAFSTSIPLLKKSKAAATKKSHKAAKEESNGNPEGSRYDKAPENNLNDVLEKTERKMEKAVDWAKGTVFDMVERGRGRVSPGECPSLYSSFSPWGGLLVFSTHS